MDIYKYMKHIYLNMKKIYLCNENIDYRLIEKASQPLSTGCEAFSIV